MLIDTHVHYNLPPFSSTSLYESLAWPAQLKLAKSQGVIDSIIVGTNLTTSRLAQKIAGETGLAFSIGIHPNEVDLTLSDSEFEAFKSDQINELTKLAMGVQKLERLVAIGECGLDYFHVSAHDRPVAIVRQAKMFAAQLDLAEKLNLPVIVHTRDRFESEDLSSGFAHADTLNLLEQKHVQKFTLHCVSGSIPYILKAQAMGGYFGFDGNLTYPSSVKLREIFLSLDKSRILLETDAPYLPPQEFRGQICQPFMICQTASFMKNELAFDPDQTTINARTLFGL